MNKLFNCDKKGFLIRFGFDEDAKYSFDAKTGTDKDGNPVGVIEWHEILNAEKYHFGDRPAKEDISEEPCGVILIGNMKSLFMLKHAVNWLFDQMFKNEFMFQNEFMNEQGKVQGKVQDKVQDIEVVQCKDCEYYMNDAMQCWNDLINADMIIEPDWFCANAVRKEYDDFRN